MSFRSTLLAAVCLCVSSVYAADSLVGGPYVVNVGSQGATVMWVVQNTEVKLGTSAAELNVVAPAMRCEKVTYCRAQAGDHLLLRSARRGGGKGTLQDGARGAGFLQVRGVRRYAVAARPAPARGGRDREGRSRTSSCTPATWWRTAATPAQWPRFFGIEKELLNKTAFFPVLGNHERNNPQYYEFFDVKTGYYSFDWGGAHFTC